MEDGTEYAAHIREDKTVQTVKEHLENVAALAKQFAEPFGAGGMAEQCGLAHDVGKYTKDFQEHLRGALKKPDHSTAGAQEILPICGISGAYCIAGHHAGLMNGGGQMDSSQTSGTLYGRMTKEINKEYQVYKQEISLQRPNPPQLTQLGTGGFTNSFFIRMLFSCLVDADFLDTEAFMKNQEVRAWNGCDLPALLKKLESFLNEKHWLEGKAGLNQKRSEILKTCIREGTDSEKGLFTLTVPTGGGKTVASLAFALHHAVAHHMRRIFYVIPYCSIIEQTVDTFGEILGAKNVLAHYSGAEYDDENEQLAERRLATENWDMPVVVTTAVQFFESLFSNKTSACRKLHNLADSVVVFDEVQTLPVSYLKPCVDAIAELTVNYGTSCVLCTATQPALQPFFKEYAPNLQSKEICPNTEELYSLFRRVRYEPLGELTDEELAQRLNDLKQVLCIVQTRKQAKNVYQLLNGEGCFHLSTLMTPRDRRDALEKIRKRLDDKKPCRVVSTSLIEAGVDVDFPTVYRAYAGLDSEIQAGGRCNREGRNAAQDSVVFLFQPESKYRVPDALKLPVQEAQSVTAGVEDMTLPAVTQAYFSALYKDKGSAVDLKGIVKGFEDGALSNGIFPFKTAARNFRFIENDTWTIFIPCDETSRRMASQLQQEAFQPDVSFYRLLGQYCVSVYQNHFQELYPSLVMVGERLGILTVKNLYDTKLGLSFQNDGGFGLIQ